ncbi:MAG: zinc metalloprotease HtpX [Nanoarchaeota archaeon]
MIENQIKTVILLGLLTGIFLWVGSIWGSTGLTIAIIFAIVFNLGSLLFSHKIVLAMYHAKEVSASEEPKLHSIIQELCRRAELPKPKIYLINSANPNAFATGPGYKTAAVAFTTGIINLLNDEELKGVAAHELSHVKNRDTLIATIAATIAGVISYVAFAARWGAIFGGAGNDRGRGNVAELLVLAILTPILAMLIQLAISRSREFIADATGAKLAHNSKGLASALEKLENGSRHNPMKIGTQSTHSLFIVNPLSGKNIFRLLSTHPPTEDRVKRLNAMKF